MLSALSPKFFYVCLLIGGLACFCPAIIEAADVIEVRYTEASYYIPITHSPFYDCDDTSQKKTHKKLVKDARQELKTKSKGDNTNHNDDLSMLIGDNVQLPLRAQLPKETSILRFTLGKTEFIFKGTMIVCMEYDAMDKKIRFKVFQAGIPQTSVTPSPDSKSQTIEVISGNSRHLTQSFVSVTEGLIRLTVPDFRVSCFDEATVDVSDGGCIENDLRTEDGEIDLSLEKINQIQTEKPDVLDAHSVELTE
jgi:hypothetical protein